MHRDQVISILDPLAAGQSTLVDEAPTIAAMSRDRGARVA